MTQDQVIAITQEAINTVIFVSAPPLLIGLAVGVLVSIFQTITSIQEPTLAFVPKILAVFIALILFGSWMLTTLQEFIVTLYNNIPNLMSI